jgi:outer membrane protein TolC
MMILAAALIAASIGGAAPGWSDETLSISQLTEKALQGNLDIVKATSAVAVAKAALAGQAAIESTRLSVSGTYASQLSATAAGGQASAQAQLSVPIVPQVSVGASAATDGTGNISLTLTPFATGAATSDEKAAWLKAVLQLDYLRSKLPYDVQAAAWAVTMAGTALANAEAALALQEDRTAVSEKSWSLGALSFEELQTSREDLIKARQSRFDALRSLLNARVALFKVLGPSAGEPGVATASLEELTALAADRDAVLAKLTTVPGSSSTLRTLQIELDALKERLTATPEWSPSLSISGQLSWTLQASAGISLSFSPSELKSDERAQITQATAEKQMEIELERMAVSLQAGIRGQALSSAREVLEARRAEVQQATTTLAESRLLQTQGQATSLDTRQAEIDLAGAQANLYAATVSLLASQADILLASTL